jgi:Fe-S cluster biosynthesis and repair protein YggX
LLAQGIPWFEPLNYKDMPEITCTRCGNAGPRLAAPPLPNELGTRIFESICGTCWQEWLQHQTALINHHGLNLLQPEAKKFLMGETETFFFSPKEDGEDG